MLIGFTVVRLELVMSVVFPCRVINSGGWSVNVTDIENKNPMPRVEGAGTFEKMIIFCPCGPTSSTSTSCRRWCLNPRNVTATLATVPVTPEILMVEGYGFAGPAVAPRPNFPLMTIGEEFGM